MIRENTKPNETKRMRMHDITNDLHMFSFATIKCKLRSTGEFSTIKKSVSYDRVHQNACTCASSKETQAGFSHVNSARK